MTLKIVKVVIMLLLAIGCISPVANAQSSTPNSNDPKKWHNEGIYYYNKDDPDYAMIQLDPTQPSGTKTGGFGSMVAQAYSGGIAKANEQTIIAGAHSKRLINQGSPKFYFYFKADDISPNLFSLVHFNEKRSSRVVVTGSSNAYGSTTGVDEKQVIDFTYDKLSDGIYRVYPRTPLPPGEYCFIYIGKAESPFASGVYDFGISGE